MGARAGSVRSSSHQAEGGVTAQPTLPICAEEEGVYGAVAGSAVPPGPFCELLRRWEEQALPWLRGLEAGAQTAFG